MRQCLPYHLLLLLLLCPISAFASTLFGSDGHYKTDNSAFYKWNQARDKHDKHLVVMKQRCTGKSDCLYKRWQSMLNEQRHKNAMSQLKGVNDFHNKHPYILDIINWGMDDYWASPYEFTLKDGDCEDYAIAKYMSLRALGIPADQLRIVVLQDENLDILHTVLAAQHEGDFYILDNQIKHVVKDSIIRHYRPIYAINEQGWWRH